MQLACQTKELLSIERVAEAVSARVSTGVYSAVWAGNRSGYSPSKKPEVNVLFLLHFAECPFWYGACKSPVQKSQGYWQSGTGDSLAARVDNRNEHPA